MMGFFSEQAERGSVHMTGRLLDDESYLHLRGRLDVLEQGLGWWSRIHETAADRWGAVNYGLGLPIVVLAAVASTSALASFDKSNVVAGILALIVAVLSALATFLNPQKTSELHRTASMNYLALAFRAASFSDELRPGTPEAGVLKRVHELEDARNKLLRESPSYSARTRRLAERKLEAEKKGAPVPVAPPTPPTFSDSDFS